LTGKDQRAALVEISREIENVRAGWQWAVAQNNLAVIDRALTGLYNFYQIRSRYQEGEEIFAQAVLQLQPQAEGANDPGQVKTGLLAKLTARRGAFCVFLGHYEAANKYLQAGLELIYDQYEVAFILNMLGEVARWQVKPAEAEAYLRRSLLINRKLNNASGLVSNLNNLTLVAGYSGNYSDGKKLATESLGIARQLERPDLIAASLHWLAWSTNYLGQYQEAETCWQESLAISREIGDQNGIGLGLNFLGWVAWCVGGSRLAEAVAYHHQALAIYHEVGNRSLLSMALADLALAVYEQGDYEAARQHSAAGLTLAEEIGNKVFTCYNRYCLGAAVCALGDLSTGRRYIAEALRLAWDTQILPHAVNALFFFAQSLVKESEAVDELEPAQLQQKAAALTLFTFIACYPACWHATQMRAARLRAELEADLPAAIITTVKAQAKNQTFEEIIGEIVKNQDYGS
jgi:tetratricopeptide (TPR) repeat protein